MNSVMSLSAGQMAGAAFYGSMTSYNGLSGILSIRATVRIVYHWNEYPPEANKVRALVANIFMGFGTLAAAFLGSLRFAEIIAPGSSFVTALDAASDVLFGVGGSIFVLGVVFCWLDDFKMPNGGDELVYLMKHGSLIPMKCTGYGHQCVPQVARGSRWDQSH